MQTRWASVWTAPLNHLQIRPHPLPTQSCSNAAGCEGAALCYNPLPSRKNVAFLMSQHLQNCPRSPLNGSIYSLQKPTEGEPERGSSGGGGWLELDLPCVHTMHCCSTAATTHTRVDCAMPSTVRSSSSLSCEAPNGPLYFFLIFFLSSVTTDDDVLEDRVARKM